MDVIGLDGRQTIILAILVLMDTLAGAAGTRVVGMMRTALGSYLPAIDLMLAAWTKGSVVLVSAKVEVRGTAAGMLATP